jgi:selenocysteine-specific elongation factor
VIIATAGHVDHGKTLLVHSLTGIETDRLEEEKDRGLTIDLGFAYIDDELGGRLGFIDVPGHIKFINNMLAGVGAIDYALLVIAADDGPMPQTLEHLAILDQLGITTGAVALTKIDRVDPTRVQLVHDQITDILRHTSLAGADIFAVSSVTGEGIEDLRTTLCLSASEVDKQAVSGHFRLAIDRCFSVKGSGLVVTGSVFSGEVETGDEIYLVPQAVAVRVRGLHTQNQPASHAQAGDRCAINIAGHNLKRDGISRGNWLTSNPHHAPTTRFDLQVKVLTTESKPMRHWTPVHVHTAANHVTARVAALEAPSIAPNETGLVQIVLNQAINVCMGDRVILRDQGALRTIAGGVIVSPYSPRRGRSRPERIKFLQRCVDLEPACALTVMLENAPIGLDIRECVNSLNMTESEVQAHVAGLEVECLGETIITRQHFAELQEQLLTRFDAWHKDNPQARGLSPNQVARFLPGRCQFVDTLVERLVAEERLVRTGNTLQRPGFSSQLSEQVQALWKEIEPLLAENQTRPPVMHDLAKELSISPRDLEKSLNECVQSGLLVRPVKNRYFVPAALEELHKLLFSAARGEDFTVKQYRDVSGIGRNLCIEILEYFDRQRITRRLGDKRRILIPASASHDKPV